MQRERERVQRVGVRENAERNETRESCFLFFRALTVASPVFLFSLLLLLTKEGESLSLFFLSCVSHEKRRQRVREGEAT